MDTAKASAMKQENFDEWYKARSAHSQYEAELSKPTVLEIASLEPGIKYIHEQLVYLYYRESTLMITNGVTPVEKRYLICKTCNKMMIGKYYYKTENPAGSRLGGQIGKSCLVWDYIIDNHWWRRERISCRENVEKKVAPSMKHCSYMLQMISKQTENH